jgi:hypothetical protein
MRIGSPVSRVSSLQVKPALVGIAVSDEKYCVGAEGNISALLEIFVRPHFS